VLSFTGVSSRCSDTIITDRSGHERLIGGHDAQHVLTNPAGARSDGAVRSEAEAAVGCAADCPAQL
jgi:hypothetical protein